MANSSFNIDNKIYQVVSTDITAAGTMTMGATRTWTDVTNGTTTLSVSITPSSASSKILIMVNLNGNSGTGDSQNYIKLLRNSTDITLGDVAGSRTSVGAGFFGHSAASATGVHSMNTGLMVLDSPATTSAITYKVQVLPLTTGSGTLYINRTVTDTDSTSFSRGSSSIIAIEILA